ncbi:MAG: VWA domain-containing protein [Candidatus Latescibacteria bacterium]|nr:VWA domain-containing protein [Candidatus Latescibacterota bacterium]
MSASIYSSDFKIYIASRCTLTVSHTPQENGATIPDGNHLTWFGLRVPVTATPIPTTYFSRWTRTTNDVIVDSTKAVTDIIVTSSHASVTANLPEKPLRTITFVKDTFNFIDDGGDPLSGVLCEFTAPTADSFYITFGPGDNLTPNYSWTYYKNDSTFSTTDSIIGANSTIYFRSDEADQRHFFRIKPQGTYQVASFSVKADSFFSLIILPDNFADVSPIDTLTLRTGQSQSISVSIPDNFTFFHNWSVSSGHATITDSLALSTNVTMDSSDAVIKAITTQKSIYTIDATLDTFQYRIHGNYVSDGILFRFIAPSIDSFYFDIQKMIAHNNYVCFYGNDSTFATVLDSQNTGGTSNAMTFSSSAVNESFYFKVRNTASTFDTLRFSTQVLPFCTLTVQRELGGTEEPVDTMILRTVFPQTIDFTSQLSLTGRYYFDHWEVESGIVAMDDSTSISPIVIPDGDATIKAVCPLRPVFTIAENWDTLSYDTIAGADKGGILFTFTSSEPDSFEISIMDIGTSSFDVFYYDTLSSCSTTVSNPAVNQKTYTIHCGPDNTGLIYLLRIQPTVAVDTLASIRIRYFQHHDLILQQDLAGSIADIDTISFLSNNPTLVDTPTVTGKYYFDHWETVSGTATMSDSTITAPEVTVLSDAVIKADYLERPVTPVTYSWDTLGFEDVDGGTHGGVLLSFTAPEADTFLFESGYITTANRKCFYYYGADENCSTIVNYQEFTTGCSFGYIATEPGQIHYFRIAPYSIADTTDSIRFRMYRFNKLILTSDHGIVSPDTSIVREGSDVSITTSPWPPDHFFNRWEIISGHAVIADSSQMSTTITVDSVDVTLEALYTPKTVYQITDVDSSYLFGTHGGRDYSGGVLLSFSPSRTDSFSIVLSQALHTPSVNLYFYGTDNSFESPIDSAQGTALTYIFGASVASTYYFRVVPVSSTYDRDAYDFTVRYDDIYYIDFRTTTGGIVNPEGSVATTDSFKITATTVPASATYYFDHWRTVSGVVAYFSATDSTDETIQVAPVGSDVVLEAQYIGKETYTLTHSPEHYQFNIEGAPKGGVLFRYISPAADSFALSLSMSTSFNYYRIDYFGTDKSFSSMLDSVKNLSAITPPRYVFRSSNAGDTLYFRIDASSAYYDKGFDIHVDTTVQLKITHDPVGTTQPADSTRLLKYGSTSVTATPISQRYRFRVWQTESGDPVFSDSTSATTNVTMSQSSTIHAAFESKPVYPLSYTPQTFTYAVDGAPDNSGGILLSFSSSTADSFIIQFSVAGTNRNINYYYYNTDSTFVGVRREFSNQSESSRFGFRITEPGVRYFFRVVPYSASYYSDSITIRVLGLTRVQVLSDGNGTTVPSGDTLVLPDVNYSVSATPLSNFYQFWKWSTLRGNVTMGNDTLASTTFMVDSTDAIIQANFAGYHINLINKMPNKVTYLYDSSIAPGLFLEMTSETADSFYLYVKHYNPSILKTIAYFGTDDHFSTAVKSYPISSANDTLFAFVAQKAAAKHYFRFTPQTNYTDSVTVMWIPARTLEVTTATGGIVSPLLPVTKFAGDTVHISTGPINPLFSFRNWAIDSGYGTISDSLSARTFVRLSESGNGIVKAFFNAKPHDTLFIEDDGNGIAVPIYMALVDTTLDTVIAAYPNSRQLFDYWEIVSGNPDIDNTGSSRTRIDLNGNARIKAHFKDDPNAKPQLVINSVNPENYRDIEVIVTLRDRNGIPITDTDSIDFVVSEDSIAVKDSVSIISGIDGVSVVLAIDRSSTMALNHSIDSAMASAKAFINTMDSIDRAAIVSFSTSVLVEQPITSNRDLLTSALNKIVVDSVGKTAIIDGADYSIQQLVNESNTRAVIIFSDGEENASNKNLAETIKSARDNNVSIYAIAVGPDAFKVADSTLKPLADSTFGYFFYARSTAELEQVYLKIKTDIESRYCIMYETPDSIYDGTAHTVVVSTKIQNNTVSDTGNWTEKNRPPRINITPDTRLLINNVQSSGGELLISAYITDDEGTPPYKRLYYRIAASPGSFKVLDLMTVPPNDSIFAATIPVDQVVKPGIEFFITATDKNGAMNTTDTFRINVDNHGPDIIHTPPDTMTAHEPVTFYAVVSDSDSVTVVLIHYRTSENASMRTDTLYRTTGDTFSVIIAGENVENTYFEYYIEAFDGYEAPSRIPTTTLFRVPIDQPPVITFSGKLEYNEGDSIYGVFSAHDPESGPTTLTLLSTYPDGAHCDTLTPSEMTLEWQTSTEDAGVYKFIFRTSDARYTVTDTISIRILNTNLPPELDAPDTVTSIKGSLIRFTIHATDAEGETVTFTSVSTPPGATFRDSLNNTAEFSWTPGQTDRYKLIYSASDGTNTITDTVYITVLDSSFYAPVVHASTTDTTIAAGKTLEILVWATDEDQTIPTLQILGCPEGSKLDTLKTSGDSLRFTWKTTGRQKIILTAIAVDILNANQTDTLYITINTACHFINVALKDTNSNGYMDRIDFTWTEEDVHLKKDLPSKDEWIDSIVLTTLNSNRIKLSPTTLNAIDSVHLIAQLNEYTAKLNTGYFDVRIGLTEVPVTEDNLPTLVEKVSDRAGPVVDSAIVNKGGITTLNSFDTLTVSFSEPVNWIKKSFTPGELFKFYGGTASNDGDPFKGLSESSILSFDSIGVRIIMDNGYSFTCETDTIKINVDKLDKFIIFSDLHDNPPLYNNRKVAIIGNYKPEITVCPNPFIPGVSTDQISGNKGALIIVQCESNASEFEGLISIFNVPGNTVLYKKSMSVNKRNSRWLTYLWDGRDRSGTKVKSGVYVALITVKNKKSGNVVATYRKKVGVKDDIK